MRTYKTSRTRSIPALVFISITWWIMGVDAAKTEDEIANTVTAPNLERVSKLISAIRFEHGTWSLYVKNEQKPIRLPMFVSIWKIVPAEDGDGFIAKLGISTTEAHAGWYYGLLCGEQHENKWSFRYAMMAGPLNLASRLQTEVYDLGPYENLNSVELTIAEYEKQFPPCDMLYFKERWDLRQDKKLKRLGPAY